MHLEEKSCQLYMLVLQVELQQELQRLQTRLRLKREPTRISFFANGPMGIDLSLVLIGLSDFSTNRKPVVTQDVLENQIKWIFIQN